MYAQQVTVSWPEAMKPFLAQFIITQERLFIFWTLVITQIRQPLLIVQYPVTFRNRKALCINIFVTSLSTVLTHIYFSFINCSLVDFPKTWFRTHWQHIHTPRSILNTWREHLFIVLSYCPSHVGMFFNSKSSTWLIFVILIVRSAASFSLFPSLFRTVDNINVEMNAFIDFAFEE